MLPPTPAASVPATSAAAVPQPPERQKFHDALEHPSSLSSSTTVVYPDRNLRNHLHRRRPCHMDRLHGARPDPTGGFGNGSLSRRCRLPNCERATAPEVEFETSDLDEDQPCRRPMSGLPHPAGAAAVLGGGLSRHHRGDRDGAAQARLAGLRPVQSRPVPCHQSADRPWRISSPGPESPPPCC